MKTNVGRTLLALGVLVLISACDKPKPAAEVDRDVAEKQSEVAKDVADARNDATSKMTSARNDARDSVQDADRKTSQAQAELLQATADANYKVAIEQASGARDIELKKCEGLASDQQTACKDRAIADFSLAQAQAEKSRSTQTPPRY